MDENRCVLLTAALFALLTVAATIHGQTTFVPNASFELGADKPVGWDIDAGDSVWLREGVDGQRAIAVKGDGNELSRNFWLSDEIAFKPDTTYRLRFQARHVEGMGGSLFTGALFNNRDLPEMTAEWQRFTTYFQTPPDMPSEAARLRFGQWNIKGMAAFDAVELAQTVPVYSRRDTITLGAGERIEGDRYAFTAPFADESGNHARPLAGFDCYFNKPRWVFALGNWVAYRHHIETVKQTSGSVEIYIGYYSGGELEVEAGTDGENWTSIGALNGRGSSTVSLPDTLFPADAVWIRMRARAASGQEADVGGSMQVYGYTYHAALDRAPGDFVGATRFVAVPESSERAAVTFTDLGSCLPGGNTMHVSIRNMTDAPLAVAPRVTAETGEEKRSESAAPSAMIPPGTVKNVSLDYDIPGVGDVLVTLDLGKDAGYRAEAAFYLSPLFAHDYGALLPDSSDDVTLWWASSGWKVSRSRPAPNVTSPAVRIQAARNEREAAQVVLRPSKPLRNLQWTMRELKNAAGDTLGPPGIEALLVGYVPITQPTDQLGAIAPWPDPLRPLHAGITLNAEENQPLWVRVYAPPNQPAGVYTGSFVLEADDGWVAEVPLEVEVFDFALPDRMTCQSAFGFEGSLVNRYHGLTTREDRQLVFDKYLAMLSAHHISPYELGQKFFYPEIEYSWPNLTEWSGGRRITDDTAPGGGALMLVDDDPTGTESARYEQRLDIPAAGLRVAFRYKTETPNHPFMFVLMHYDAEGNWIPMRNIAATVEGDGTWQSFETVIDQFPENAVQFIFELQPTLYAEDGSTLGTVWVNNLRVSDAGTGATLIEDDFTPYTGEDLVKAFMPEFRWDEWDAKMEHILNTYHFNSFVIRTPGLGWGAGWAQHDDVPGNLLGYGPGSPEYEAAFKNWYHEVQEHLRKKGWLEEAFVYWFDEPEPHQYEFVMKYNLLMKEAAPDLQRKLTEQVEPELIGGPNLWCPISFEYDHDRAEERRAAGERFWWYICTGPKAPYATLFIDHPGTELRVWLWQTWQRNIEGVLIWALNWWTSDAAYPDGLQNPYEDPMSWRHTLGEIVPRGAKQPWGNGDGRFLYPPLAAADGNPDAPVLDGPVASIRLNMLRDGIEDYEYLVILKNLIDQHRNNMPAIELAAYEALLEVPEAITSSLTEFTWEPAPIEAHREAVARAIERLAN